MADTSIGTSTITGYFEDSADAGQAVEALQQAGFTSAHLGVARREGVGTTGLASGSNESTWDKVKNFFTGTDAEPYADERTQGDFANREITASPADTYGTSGYGATDLHQGLTGLDVPEEHSRYFSHRLGSSARGAVVTVNAGSRAAEAQAILTRYGADLGEGAAGYDYSQTAEIPEAGRIQLLGEVLRVQKERISRGEVVLRKEVITETQTVQVPVTREELVIERVAASGTTPATGTIGEDSVIRIPLSEERASIDKSTVVREEVAVGKRSVEEVRDLGGEIRHEELVVDDQTKTGRGI